MTQAVRLTPKRINDPEGTKRDILAVATHEFAYKGLSGARVDEIAEKTNSSKRMIYYYFGGKAQLYQAVLAQAYYNIRQEEMEQAQAHLEPEAALAAIITSTADYHNDHPEFVRLVMNENINLGQHLKQIESRMERNQSIIAKLQSILDDGVNKGVFRSGINAIDLHIAITAQSFYTVSNRHTFLLNFGIDMAEEAARATHVRNIIDMILTWVKKGA
jgi:AcrR family transcriptional regulator